MAKWEFCKVERLTIGPAPSEGGKNRPERRESVTDRPFLFRMAVQQFTPVGLKTIDQTEEYRAYRDDAIHNEMGEKLMAKLGQEGWEPFFTDTRSSQNYFSWHLKRKTQD